MDSDFPVPSSLILVRETEDLPETIVFRIRNKAARLEGTSESPVTLRHCTLTRRRADVCKRDKAVTTANGHLCDKPILLSLLKHTNLPVEALLMMVSVIK
jgi:hypothetical protein